MKPQHQPPGRGGGVGCSGVEVWIRGKKYLRENSRVTWGGGEMPPIREIAFFLSENRQVWSDLDMCIPAIFRQTHFEGK